MSALIRIFRVVAQAESPDRFTARAGRGLTPLVGRSAELDMLRQRWEQARDGEMRCVMLVGEAGIGKSRIVHAFRDGLADQPHQIVSWHCSAYYRNSAFFPVVTWLCRSLGIDPQGDHAGGARKLEEAAKGLEIGDPKVAAILASLLGLTVDKSAPQEASGLAFRRQLLDALSLTILAMARRQALFMVVEDAHWADPSTLDLLRELQERLAASRLLLLVTARPEFRPDWNYPQFVQVNLDRLSRRERQAMIERNAARKIHSPTIVLDQIVNRTRRCPAVRRGTHQDGAGGKYLAAKSARPLCVNSKARSRGLPFPTSLQGSLLGPARPARSGGQGHCPDRRHHRPRIQPGSAWQRRASSRTMSSMPASSSWSPPTSCSRCGCRRSEAKKPSPSATP